MRPLANRYFAALILCGLIGLLVAGCSSPAPEDKSTTSTATKTPPVPADIKSKMGAHPQ